MRSADCSLFFYGTAASCRHIDYSMSGVVLYGGGCTSFGKSAPRRLSTRVTADVPLRCMPRTINARRPRLTGAAAPFTSFRTLLICAFEIFEGWEGACIVLFFAALAFFIGEMCSTTTDCGRPTAVHTHDPYNIPFQAKPLYPTLSL